MKNYHVTLALIVGYYDHNYNEPKIKFVEYKVIADSEQSAIEKAKKIDNSGFSIYDSYAT